MSEGCITGKRACEKMSMENHIIDLLSYDKYVVSFSGGKDSTATFLYLLEHGVPVDRIELWHQEVDGREKTSWLSRPMSSTAASTGSVRG